MSSEKEMRKIFNKTDTLTKGLSGLFLGMGIQDRMKEGKGVASD